MAKEIPPAGQGLRHHISSANDQDVEDVIDQRRTSGSIILEQVEGWPTALVKGNDFTVNHGLIGHRRKSIHDGWIPHIEIVVVSRSERHATARFYCQSSVPVLASAFGPLSRQFPTVLLHQQQNRFRVSPKRSPAQTR